MKRAGGVAPNWLAASASHSRLSAGVRAIGRWFVRVDAAVARAANEESAAADDNRARALARDSRLVQAIDWMLTAPARAWDDSRVRPLIESVDRDVRALPIADRIRLGGLMLSIALVTRVILYVVSGAPVTVISVTVWSAVLGLALVLMLASHAVAAAWVDWRRRGSER